jgi:hypothetical protein
MVDSGCVAREYGVSWWSANQALIDRAADVLGPAEPGVRRLGIDETRVRRVRWLLEEAGWTRSDPWMTGFVDLDRTGRAGCSGSRPGVRAPRREWQHRAGPLTAVGHHDGDLVDADTVRARHPGRAVDNVATSQHAHVCLSACLSSSPACLLALSHKRLAPDVAVECVKAFLETTAEDLEESPN